MQGGGSEPHYEPAAGSRPAQHRLTRTIIRRARCMKRRIGASRAAARRLQRDYGYWYVPGPRDPSAARGVFRAPRRMCRHWRPCLRERAASDSLSAPTISLRRPTNSNTSRAPSANASRRVSSDELPARARRFRDALSGAFAAGRRLAERVECVVIGAGVVGLACARALARAGREVIVLERHGQIGTETSSRNSEVIHAGIYYDPGSLKARLCVRGNALLYRALRELRGSISSLRQDHRRDRPGPVRNAARLSAARRRQRN